jgi:hypothetical protein
MAMPAALNEHRERVLDSPMHIPEATGRVLPPNSAINQAWLQLALTWMIHRGVGWADRSAC